MRRAACETARARALRVEESGRGDYCPAVVEERHELHRASERAEQSFRDQDARVAAHTHVGIDAARARIKVVRDFARARERMNQLRARALAVREQSCDAAPVYAAPRRQKVVARAPRDAA